MNMPTVGLIAADEYLLKYIEGSVEQLQSEGFVWYGLIRHPAAASAHLEKKITPLHLKHYINKTHTQIATRWAEAISLEDPSTWTIAGIELGKYFQYEHNLYGTQGENDFKKLKEILHWAACMTQGLLELIDEVKPSIIIIWNGSQYPHSVYRAVSDTLGIPAHYVERGYLAQSHTMNKSGVNDQALLPQFTQPTQEEYQLTEAIIDKVVQSKASVVKSGSSFTADEIRRYLNIPADKKMLLLPLQIDTDTNIILHAKTFKTNASVVEAVAKAIEDTDYHLVVKPHPEEKHFTPAKARAMVGEHGSIIEGVDLSSLLAAVDGVVVRNSTVGFEALLHAIPVINLSNVLYANFGATLPATNAEEIHLCLTKLDMCREESWWKTKTIPTVWHLLSKYHVFEETFMGLSLDLQNPLKALVNDAKTIQPLSTHSAAAPTLSPQSLDYEVEAVDKLCQELRENQVAPLLVIDHTAAVDLEPVLARILESFQKQQVHLVSRGDREVGSYPHVSLFDKEVVSEVSSLILNRYSAVIVLTESTLLLSKKVRCFVGAVQAGGRYVVETSGAVLEYERSQLFMGVYSDLSQTLSKWASNQNNA